MSAAASTLMAVLIVAPTPLGPTHAAVELDTVWLPIGTCVKVKYYKYGRASHQLCVKSWRGVGQNEATIIDLYMTYRYR
jgi:hypothetical protein